MDAPVGEDYLILPLRAHKRHQVVHVVAEYLALARLEQLSKMHRDVLVPLRPWRDALEKKVRTNHQRGRRLHRSGNLPRYTAVQSNRRGHVKANNSWDRLMSTSPPHCPSNLHTSVPGVLANIQSSVM